jgi:asparagine synthase (glutamine-hydrolysing)
MTSNLVAAEPGDFLATLRSIIWHLEAPESSPAVFPLWNIARHARSKVTVLLEGQGADEVLAGYAFNFFDAMIDRIRAGQIASAAGELRWAMRTIGGRRAVVLAARKLNPPFLHKAFRLARGIERVFVGPLRGGAESDEPHIPSARPDDWLNRSLVEQIEGNLVSLLHYGDAISMAHSLESRLPFLDYRLVKYCAGLPGHYKFREGFGKAVLRQAMRGSVPDSILDSRVKLGFPVPIGKWFRERPDETIYPVLRSAECRARGIFEPREVEKAIARHVSGAANLSANLYRWLVTELWFQAFIDRKAAVIT